METLGFRKLMQRELSFGLAASVFFIMLLFGAFAFSLLMPKTVSAAGVVAPCDETTLRARLVGGGTVTFNCASAAFTILLADQITITADTVIDGGTLGNVTLSGNNVTRIFTVTSGVSLTVKNLILANGKVDTAGGAIFNNGTLNVISSTFRNNIAISTGSNDVTGGAIENVGDLNVSNSTFANNTVSAVNGHTGGAAIQSRNKLTITNSLIENNLTVGGIVYGGAVFNNLSAIVNDSIIRSNVISATGTSEGAGFSNYFGTAVISNSLITGNMITTTASAYGGGIDNYGVLTITNSTISNNKVTSTTGDFCTGAGIDNADKLTIINSSIVSNSTEACFGFGGGVTNFKQLVVTAETSTRGTTFSNNTATSSIYAYGGGGAIWNGYGASTSIEQASFLSNSGKSGGGILSYGTITVTRSSFISNTATGTNPFEGQGGGGLSNRTNGNISNSTFSGNTAVNGGGLNNYGNLSLINNTIVSNTATTAASIDNSRGGGITENFTEPSVPITITNTIIASSSGGTCTGPIINGGNNIDSGAGCGFGSGNNSFSNVNPQLEPLAQNGGPTLTHALLPGSVARDAGNNSICTTTPVNSVDQRGYTRVSVAGGAQVGANCDIGAFEYTAPTPALNPPPPINFTGTQLHQSPILNTYQGLDFKPCFNFWDWNIPAETTPLKSPTTGQPGYAVTGNKTSTITSNSPNFSCEIDRATANSLAPKAIRTLDAEDSLIWAFSVSTPAPVIIEGVNSSNTVVVSTTVQPNYAQGQATSASVQGVGITKVRIKPNFTAVSGNTRCDLSTNSQFNYCVAVNLVQVTTIPATPAGSALKLLPNGTFRLATTQNNARPVLTTNAPNPSVGNASTTQITAWGGDIPNTATGIVGVLTNLSCSGGANFRFWTGNTVPFASNLNVPGANPALNLSTGFVAPLDSAGKVYLGLGSGANVSCGYIVDVVGYLTNSANLTLLPTGTYRLATTQDGTKSKLTSVGAVPAVGNTSTAQITAWGQGGIPNTATGIFGVVTNVGCNNGGNFRFWTGSTPPNAANLNVPGAFPSLNLSTNFIAPLDAQGKFNLGLGSGVTTTCGYIVDVVGYIVGNTDINLLANTVRAATTIGNLNPFLISVGAAPSLGNSSTLQISINSVPANAKGVVGVLTNVGCNSGGNFRFWTGSLIPNASNLNVPGANFALNLSTGFTAPLTLEGSTGKVYLGLGSGVITTCGYAVDVIGFLS